MRTYNDESLDKTKEIREDIDQDVEGASKNEGYLIDIIGGFFVLIILLIILIGFLGLGGIRGGRYVLSIFILGAGILIFGYIKLINKKDGSREGK